MYWILGGNLLDIGVTPAYIKVRRIIGYSLKGLIVASSVPGVVPLHISDSDD